MQAILITCYTDKQNLIKLVKSFNDEMNVYVHINSTSKELFEDDLNFLNYQNLTVIKKYNTSWGSYGHLLAAIELMKMATSNEENEYIHLISGQDYKIKTNDYFFENFENNNTSYISYVPAKDSPKHIQERYTKGMFSSYFSLRNKKVTKINKVYTSLYNKDHIGEFKEIYKGMLWTSMHKQLCKYILKYIENNPEFMEDLKHCSIPEEFFIQTIIMNSEYKSNVMRTHLRYTDWNFRNGNRPAVLDETDFDKFKDSFYLFVRKVSTGISDELVKLIDENLLNDETPQKSIPQKNTTPQKDEIPKKEEIPQKNIPQKGKLINKNDLINTISTKDFENLPKESYNIINQYDDEISCYELFEIFNEIIECSSLLVGDTTDKCEELLSYFDMILEKYELY